MLNILVYFPFALPMTQEKIVQTDDSRKNETHWCGHSSFSLQLSQHNHEARIVALRLIP